MNLTYRQLAEKIATLTDEQKDCNVTIYDVEDVEYYPVADMLLCWGKQDVLDEGHPVLSIKNPESIEPEKSDYNSWEK